jgi:hypothetical protein
MDHASKIRFNMVKLLRFLISFLPSSTNKTDRHNITEILLKVASNTINQIHDTIYQYMENKLQILNLIRLGKNEIKNLNNLTHERGSNSQLWLRRGISEENPVTGHMRVTL